MKENIEPRGTYHHGNLPETLIKEAAELLAEKGIEGFSMREIARRAGVAVAAPSHHFGNAKGLLTAVAAQGFQKLGRRMALAAEDQQDSTEKAIAMCLAYVDMRVRSPGHAIIMFRLDLLDEENPELTTHAFAAFGQLMQVVASAVATHGDAALVERATKTLWSTMHGLVALTMIDEREAKDLVDFAVRNLFAGMRTRHSKI